MLRLVDNRNADPAIFRKARIAPQRAISVGFEVKIPDVDDLEPTPALREMVENAFASYFDDTLADRVDAAETAARPATQGRRRHH
jgi:hypothetical protein